VRVCNVRTADEAETKRGGNGGRRQQMRVYVVQLRVIVAEVPGSTNYLS
jgi:hypothetical protein